MLARRSFIGGLAGLIAAPAIVRASSLMPVRSWGIQDEMSYAETMAALGRMGAWYRVHPVTGVLTRCPPPTVGFLFS